MVTQQRETTYEQWIRQEGLPTVSGYGVTDVQALELGTWKRLGGRGACIELVGMEGLTGLYVGEIPPGGALAPEKHLYDELIYVLAGRGAMEVWHGTGEQPEHPPSFFEWQAGSLFTPPLNTWHRLLNGSGSEPVRFLAATTAPLVLDLFHSPEFVYGCDYRFADRYDGRAGYYKVGERRLVEKGQNTGWFWETNFIPNVRGATLDGKESMGAGLGVTFFEMGGNVLVGHMAEWPVGRYRKAHYHGGGAILLIVRSQGYTLLWPPEAGIQPYQSGHGHQVVQVDWQEGSVLSPPTGWFHQHFNTGPGSARQLALRYGSAHYGVRFYDVQAREGCGRSVKEGGTQIEYEDEDPEIRRLYEAECARNGVEVLMPPVTAATRG